MSTRLYGGRIAHMPIEEVHSHLVAEKPKIVELGKAIINEQIAKLTASKFDRISIGKAKKSDKKHTASNMASDAYKEIIRRFENIRVKRERDPEIDTEFDVYLFPDGDSTLMMLNCEQDRMIEALQESGWIYDYSWQNATDSHDGVSDKAWARRERDWERLLPSGVPADTCLTFNMFHGNIALSNNPKHVWAAIPSVETRLRALAEDAYITKKWDHNLPVSQIFAIKEQMANSPAGLEAEMKLLENAIVHIAPDTPLKLRM